MSDCKNCEAPKIANVDHANAGECRQAQRRVIKELRAENERLRGAVHEQKKMRGDALTLEVPINEAARVLKGDTRMRVKNVPISSYRNGCLCNRPDFRCPIHG